MAKHQGSVLSWSRDPLQPPELERSQGASGLPLQPWRLPAQAVLEVPTWAGVLGRQNSSHVTLTGPEVGSLLR